MWIKSTIYITLFVISILFIFSCEKVKHTSYRMLIINEASINYTVKNEGYIKLDTVLVPLSIDSYKCGVSIYRQGIRNEVLNKLTEEEFAEKVSSLIVYYLSNNDTIYYGGNKDFSRQESNWEYDYSEDDGYGLHEYILRIEN